ncbi:MAG: hypothetical protein GY780_14350 [bacterium]|nr:hypothetical protein [bacterium]
MTHPQRRQFFLTFLMMAILTIGVSAPKVCAQSNDDCMDCHDDEEETKNVDGEVISLYVDLERFEHSIHGQEDMSCIDCHEDLDGFDDFPHDEELEPVSCENCHDSEEYEASMHGQAMTDGNPLAPQCWDCHGYHFVLPPSDHASTTNVFNIPKTCGNCHREGAAVGESASASQDSVLAHYSQSIHGIGLTQKGLTTTAVCTSCHTGHNVRNHIDPESTIHRDNVVATCSQCHGLIEEVHEKVIQGELWESEPDKIPVCIECHQPHEVRQVYYDEGMSDQECLSCHTDENLIASAPGSNGESMYVDTVELGHSSHENISCIQCHTGASLGHDRPCDTIPNKVDCAICHAEDVAIFNSSIHGQMDDQGDPDSPNCLDCHIGEGGNHNILPHDNTKAPTHVRNIPDLCGQCHDEGGVADVRYEGTEKSMVANYKESVHGRALNKSGLVVTATCVSCHSSHAILPHSDVNSTINRSKIDVTCAQCHLGIDEVFRESIHFTGKGTPETPLPMCNDCHSSHEIARTDAAGFKSTIANSCGKCHEHVTETYFETFHGKVFQLGNTNAAKCSDCHGQHNVLPKDNPESTLSHENIVDTCGKCHTGSHRQFTGYLTHATHHDKDKFPAVHYTWLFMTSLLVGTFVVFGIHTLLWMPRSFEAIKHSRQLRKMAKGEKQFRRFGSLERSLHVMVIVSFLTLAVSGMTLKFSYQPWAQWLSGVLGGFQSTGTLHRMAAFLTFFYFTRHVINLFAKRSMSGKSWGQFIFGPEGMMFNARDGVEFVETLKWFLHKGERPQYGRWTYWEKFDYFAVFWGVAMIGVSGLILWFPELFTRFLPGQMINIATIIHSDEALLATGFIFTIHFFNTHFRPDRFPMDPVIFTGRMTLAEFKEDRPREYAQLVEEGRLEEHMVDPLPDTFVTAMKVFGFTALTIGLGLIITIIVAVVFGVH